ncbi:FG-GAP-like repeat-containing protein, partial [uncultured Polaribacter sp.]|uniref:FG-GAP-like repeat-containing protein n=1 Tax=uncultured Polaribacter sp. TaxID=174711 RepID=UPI0032B20D83
FGLNNATKVDSIVVTWPNQMKTVKRNLTVNQTIQIAMNTASKPADTAKVKKSDVLFTNSSESFDLNFKHTENSFDDYKYQVLLPHKLSQIGPAMAAGDVNNDGLDDLYLGGASGFSGYLYIQNKNGSFTNSNIDFWKKESPYEDIDALFVDINNDGFQDLYVVSGGNEYPANDEHYADRLYINDGKGGFSKAAILNITRDSGAVVKAADYDKDGDMDLFVGGRHVPHQYPLPANSMFLKNENGQLVNVTQTLAKELNGIGLVTDAVWNDYDGDGDTDLTLVGEWMPITFFRNDKGVLNKVVATGLENETGWWFSIEKGDFDKDGDVDFIAGNLGLNYKYKTSKEKPFDIYYDDFDTNGRNDIVLGYYQDNKHFPLRGFSCSSEQIPDLKGKIEKYDVFAALEIEQVYGDENLQNALHYKATTFASSYIENIGNGRFKMTPLPIEAQFSNINDMEVADFNKDGSLDVLTVGNLFASEIETPRNDAGTGLLILGDGKGGFSALTNKESGFFANRNAKKTVIISNKQQKKLLIANNNDKLQCFTLK